MDLISRLPRRTTWAARQLRVPGFVLTAGRHPGGSELPQHSHTDPTICYVLRGGFVETSGGREADCAPGTLKLMPAGETHWNRFGRDETRGVRIDVDRSRFADFPVIHRALDERRQVHGGSGNRIAERLAGELQTADEAGVVAVEGLVLELVAALVRAPAVSAASHRPSAWLRAAEDLVQAQYLAPPSVAEIARAVGVHPATLARAWREQFGCSIGERIRELRVEHAAHLLRTSEDPLSIIAAAAGFYDQSHLTNLFRQQYGVTPGRYRAATK
ncbi:MAG: helix-turn-helix domain-containing protein [Gemmatimonadales bacterium]